MKRLLGTSIIAALSITPAFGQTATAVGTGVGIANSKSTSTAVAISGQGGQGGIGKGGSATSALTINQTTPAVTSTTVNNTGTQTIRNVPTEFAPGLAAAGLETCLGSVSGGGAFVGTGFSFGTTIPDPGCATRLDARTLWSFGLKKAAVARLCLNNDIYRSMPEVCVRYLPYYTQAGYVAPVSDARSNFLSANANTDGSILLIEGSTGKERLCNDYDVAGQRCRVWAYGVTHHSSASKKLASRGNVTASAAHPSSKPVTPSAVPTSTAEVKEGSPK